MLAAQAHMLGDAGSNLPAHLHASAPKVLEFSAMDGCKLFTNGMAQDTNPYGATLVSEGLTGPFHQLVLLAGLAAFCQTVGDDKLDWIRPVSPPSTTPHEGRSRLHSYPPPKTE